MCAAAEGHSLVCLVRAVQSQVSSVRVRKTFSPATLVLCSQWVICTSGIASSLKDSRQQSASEIASSLKESRQQSTSSSVVGGLGCVRPEQQSACVRPQQQSASSSVVGGLGCVRLQQQSASVRPQQQPAFVEWLGREPVSLV